MFPGADGSSPVIDAVLGVSSIFGIVSLGILAVELAWLRHRKRLDRRRILEMLGSYSLYVPSVVVDAVIGGTILALYFFVHRFAPWTIPTTWWTAPLALLIVDLTYYWEHRVEHEVRVFWALYHSVHHSSGDFNQATAYRVSFVDEFFAPLYYLPLVAVGFHPILILACFLFIIAYQAWIHTEMIGRLGFVESVFNTASNHRVHHGANEKYLDKNYGAVLIVWDRLFGTYQAEEETPVYGLTKPLDSVNPMKIHAHEAVELWRDLRGARSVREALAYLFRRPAWRPAGASSGSNA